MIKKHANLLNDTIHLEDNDPNKTTTLTLIELAAQGNNYYAVKNLLKAGVKVTKEMVESCENKRCKVLLARAFAGQQPSN